MAYILVGRKKGTKQKFRNLGPYVFEKKSDFGSLNRLKKDNPNLEIKIIER